MWATRSDWATGSKVRCRKLVLSRLLFEATTMLSREYQIRNSHGQESATWVGWSNRVSSRLCASNTAIWTSSPNCSKKSKRKWDYPAPNFVPKEKHFTQSYRRSRLITYELLCRRTLTFNLLRANPSTIGKNFICHSAGDEEAQSDFCFACYCVPWRKRWQCGWYELGKINEVRMLLLTKIRCCYCTILLLYIVYVD